MEDSRDDSPDSDPLPGVRNVMETRVSTFTVSSERREEEERRCETMARRKEWHSHCKTTTDTKSTCSKLAQAARQTDG